MPDDPTNRISLALINASPSNLLGISHRNNGVDTPFYGNHFLRNDWGTSDRFRGVQGKYLSFGAGTLINQIDVSTAPLHFTPGPTEATPTSGDRISYNTNYLLEPNDSSWNAENVAGTIGLLRRYIQDPGVFEGDPYYGQFLESGVPIGLSANSTIVGNIQSDWLFY